MAICVPVCGHMHNRIRRAALQAEVDAEEAARKAAVAAADEVRASLALRRTGRVTDARRTGILCVREVRGCGVQGRWDDAHSLNLRAQGANAARCVPRGGGAYRARGSDSSVPIVCARWASRRWPRRRPTCAATTAGVGVRSRRGIIGYGRVRARAIVWPPVLLRVDSRMHFRRWCLRPRRSRRCRRARMAICMRVCGNMRIRLRPRRCRRRCWTASSRARSRSCGARMRRACSAVGPAGSPHAAGARRCNAPIERVVVADRASLVAAAERRVGKECDTAGKQLSLDAIVHRDEFRCAARGVSRSCAARGVSRSSHLGRTTSQLSIAQDSVHNVLHNRLLYAV